MDGGDSILPRSQLIAKVAKDLDMPAAQVELVLDAVCGDIIQCLAEGEKVTITGFGRFEMRERKTKAYTNPKTKATSQLPPVSVPGFKASSLMKEKIAQAR